MRVRMWDELLQEKVRGWYPNSHFINEPNDIYDLRRIVQERGVEENNRTWPAIAIYRMGVPRYKEENNNWARIVDNPMYNPESGDAIQLWMFEATYQIDIYAKTREHIDELALEIMMELKTHPNVEASTLQAEEEYGHTTMVLSAGEIIDNSEMETFRDSLRLYRATIEIIAKMPILRKVGVNIIESASIEVTTDGGVSLNVVEGEMGND